MAERIDFNTFLARSAADITLKKPFHPILSDDASLVKVGVFRFLELFGGNFSDIPEDMRGRRTTQIVALRLHLDHHSRQVQTVRFDDRGLAKRQTILDLSGLQLAALTGRQFFMDELGI